jgi:hypothetical protein
MKMVILNIPLFKYKTAVVDIEEGMNYLRFMPSGVGHSLTLFCVCKNNLINTYFIQDSENDFAVNMSEYKSFWFERASSFGGGYTIYVQFSDRAFETENL